MANVDNTYKKKIYPIFSKALPYARQDLKHKAPIKVIDALNAQTCHILRRKIKSETFTQRPQHKLSMLMGYSDITRSYC